MILEFNDEHRTKFLKLIEQSVGEQQALSHSIVYNNGVPVVEVVSEFKTYRLGWFEFLMTQLIPDLFPEDINFHCEWVIFYMNSTKNFKHPIDYITKIYEKK